MLLECEQCRSRFNLDDSLLAKEGSRVRCTVCRHTFVAYPAESEPPEEPATQEEAEEELEETVALDSTPVDEERETAYGEVAGEKDFEEAFSESLDEEFETVSLDEMTEPDEEEEAGEEAFEEAAAISDGTAAEEHEPREEATTDERPEAVEPAPSEMKPRWPRPLPVVLVLLVLVLGGSVAIFFFAPHLIPDSLSVLKPAKRQEITDLGVRRLSFQEVNGFFVQSDKAGQLFVVRGKVSNNYPKSRSFIFIKGSLLDDRGQVVQTNLVYAGNTLTDEEMKTMSLEEINKGLKNQYGKGRMNLNIQPDASVPFMIVFGNLPDNLSEFTVEAVKSSPAD